MDLFVFQKASHFDKIKCMYFDYEISQNSEFCSQFFLRFKTAMKFKLILNIYQYFDLKLLHTTLIHYIMYHDIIKTMLYSF